MVRAIHARGDGCASPLARGVAGARPDASRRYRSLLANVRIWPEADARTPSAPLAHAHFRPIRDFAARARADRREPLAGPGCHPCVSDFLRCLGTIGDKYELMIVIAVLHRDIDARLGHAARELSKLPRQFLMQLE